MLSNSLRILGCFSFDFGSSSTAGLVYPLNSTLRPRARTFPTGIELPQYSEEKPRHDTQSGAESGAVGAPVEPDLARIITIWNRLPATVRAGIIAMIDRAEARARTT
jgi:hypothetical protein